VKLPAYRRAGARRGFPAMYYHFFYIVPLDPAYLARAGWDTAQSKVETKPRPALMIDRREKEYGIR